MKTFQLYPKDTFYQEEGLAICLGYFDGVHVGHKHLISLAVKCSPYPVALATFDKPVSSLIDNHKSKEVLTSLNDRFRIIDRLGVDYYFVMHISPEFLKVSKEDFIIKLKSFNVKEIYVGDDYHFGKNRSGCIEDLKQHFKVIDVPFETYKGKKVSTQSIIQNIKDGDINIANLLLGQNYQISGTVTKGHQNGTKLGIKTANIKLDDNYVIPKFGVYKVIAYIDGVPHLSMANVGTHPTIDEEDKPVIEVHIPGMNDDLYGKAIFVEFIQYIRPEIKFKSTDELVKQVNKDLTLIQK